MLDLSIRNTAAFDEVVTRAITAAFGGDDPQNGLDQAAEEWDRLTDRIGVDVQKRAYPDWARIITDENQLLAYGSKRQFRADDGLSDLDLSAVAKASH